MYKKTAAIGTLLVSSAMVIGIAPNAEAATTQEKAASVAKAQIGDPYKWGAKGPNAFDCSGLVWYSFNKAGKAWSYKPTNGMRKYQTNDITVSQRKVGDLIFFRRKGSSDWSHVGIYVGSGYMVNAVNGNTYKGVRKGKIVDGYWNKYYSADYRRVK
ncbi:minor tail protein [Streptomyces phage Blueeyedbeauty]|uniref:Hydrolase n=1 Tax=Streptomyces phage Blueeyedbeauty TaxID=2250336 RepID=A0A345L231_9CAUD|nr:minor tail protein [Streptomyces phage Blueeyedbeauty]AXH49333.1 hydrolase [Streptomyces phage Blueeyedbeauty]